MRHCAEHRDLAVRMKAGDRSARERLIWVALRFVNRHLRKYVRPEWRDECRSVVLADLLESVHLFDPERRSWVLWCMMRARYVVERFVHEERRASRVVLLHDDDEAVVDPAADPVADGMRGERFELFERALKCLEPRRQKIMRKVLAGESAKAIAREMKLTRERVRQLEVKATDRLRREACRLTRGEGV